MRVVNYDITTSAGVADSSTVTATLEVPEEADKVIVTVDDNSGNDPASYDLEITVDPDAPLSNHVHKTQAGKTARTTEAIGVGGTYTIELTNASGGAADYRLRTQALAPVK